MTQYCCRFVRLCLLCLLPLSGRAAAQRPIDCTGGRLLVDGLTTVSADYARLAEISGITHMRSGSVHRMSEHLLYPPCVKQPEHPWRDHDLPPRMTGLQPLPATVRLVNNTGWARTANDGPLWAGRGVSSDVSAGIHGRWGVVSAAVAPVVAWQQNRPFAIHENELPGFSPFAYPFHRGTEHLYIDWPQRFGAQSFWTLHPGQSFLRADAFGAVVGVSTENMWFGPGIRNSILMSNTAGGFPHLFVGTSRPAGIWIGTLDAQIIWGGLGQSDYFDADPRRGRRLFTGLVAEFTPRGVPGLRLGGTRVYYELIPESGLEFSDYFPFLESLFKRDLATPDNPSGTDLSDQLGSLYFRWALPASGFEVYGEYARTDHAWDFSDLLREPDHSRAYTLGLQSVFGVRGGDWLRLGAEVTVLGDSRASTYRTGRGGVRYYAHDQAYQGYTHRGQLLGAGIGPGSDAQTVWADYFAWWGRTGLFVERIRYDDDAYYRYFQPVYLHTGHDAELTGGLAHTHRLGPVMATAALAYSSRLNRAFLGCGDTAGPPRSCWPAEVRSSSWQMRLETSWRPELPRSGR